MREAFGVEPDEWQKEALIHFRDHNRVALKASKGVGKTSLLAWCAWNFLCTRLHPKIVATSVSWDNLSDGFWTEMAKWQGKNTFLKKQFTWTKTKIFSNDHPETWYLSARTWSKSGDKNQQANTLAGLHADYLLFILDEVGDIPDGVMAAAEAGLASGIETKIIMAGNPTNLEGPLYRACTSEANLWKTVTINADPDDPKRSNRVSVEWARDQIQKYGRTNNWVLVNVFGQFPSSSINTLLGHDEVYAAMNREIHEESYKDAQKRLGVDVSRFGSDRTIIFPRQGLRAFTPVEMRNARTNDIAARVMQAKVKWGSELEFIDGTGGFGGGVVDSLIQAGCSPNEVHFSGKATDSRYYNKRAEIWFVMAEWIKRGGVLPNDPELLKELTTPTYTFQNGKFMLESKDQIKERLGSSPDKADGLCLTFALPELPSQTSFLSVLGSKKYKHDYDPFATD